MKLQSLVSSFGLAALFVICSTSANATAVFSFTDMGALGGTIVAPGNNGGPVTGAVTTFTNVPYNDLVVAGAKNHNGDHPIVGGTLSFNKATDVLTLTGSIPTLLGLFVSSTLVTIDLNGGLSGTTTNMQGSFSLATITNVKSITESSTLLADLGLTGYTSSLSGLGVVGEGNPNGSGTYQAISDTMGITLNSPTAPEPVSYALTVAGLVALACFRRKLSSAVK